MIRGGGTASVPPPHRGLVPALLFIGSVVSVISSLGAPLIPAIAEDLGTTLGSAQWSLTVTLVVGAVATPIVGRVGDGRWRREVLLVCLAAVTAGGTLAALAHTLPVLVAGRSMQGLGLALLPLTMATARDSLSRERAPSVIVSLSVIGAAGVGLGYPLTGLLADVSGTAAAFWFGVVTSGAALVVATAVVPSTRRLAKQPPIDVVGALLVATGLVGLLIGLQNGMRWGWGSAQTAATLAVAVVALALWCGHELRVANPLVDLRLFRHVAVLTANVSGLLVGIAMYLGITLTTQVVQLPRGMDGSVLLAGIVLVPFATLSVLASRAVPVSRRHLGDRMTIPVGCSAIAAGALIFATTDGTHLWATFVTMGLFGVGGGFTFAAMPTLIIGAVPSSETSSAMSLHQVTRYVGFSFGSGLCVTLLHVFAADGRPPAADAYRAAFAVAALVALGAAALAYVLSGRVVGRPGGHPTMRRGGEPAAVDAVSAPQAAGSTLEAVGPACVARVREEG